MKGVGLPPDSDFLWTNGVVPYVVDAGLPNADRVTQAITHIHDNTAIRLVPRTNQANYVRFVRNPDAGWSSSAIGMRGGEQLIRLSDGASMGTVVHESCHALGVLHEQSRCDRDSFVQINYANITEGFESNFDKFCDGYDDYFDYDYDSIMHYPAGAFSKNGQPTIVVLQPGVTIGQRTGLSFGDRITIAHMYARFFGKGHTGVWRSGNGGYGLWANATWDSFGAKWQEWAGQGLRLVDINVHQAGADTRYSGTFLPGTDGYYLWANVPWESFWARWQQLGAKGLRLVDYEFTEPAAADGESLDIAGTPASAPSTQHMPIGAGGTSPMDAPATAPSDSRPIPDAAVDGQGGYQSNSPTEPMATTEGPNGTADGVGGAYPGETSANSPATEDGIGAAVTDGTRPAVEALNGLGKAVLA